uniref:Ribosomal protein n=1 Tax=Timema shepardi TaxID=629360 RepID=A0A7R9AQT8_TIMSH|nr:unnamed protein product [Timema shepardi]
MAGKSSAPDNELQSTESAVNDVGRRESMFQNKKDLFPFSSPHHRVLFNMNILTSLRTCIWKSAATRNIQCVVPILGENLQRNYHGVIKTFDSLTQTKNLTSVSLFKPLLNSFVPMFIPVCGFKVKGKLKRRCKDCYFVMRQERLYVICKTHPRHKQMAMKKKEKNTWILTHATQGPIRAWYSNKATTCYFINITVHHTWEHSLPSNRLCLVIKVTIQWTWQHQTIAFHLTWTLQVKGNLISTTTKTFRRGVKFCAFAPCGEYLASSFKSHHPEKQKYNNELSTLKTGVDISVHPVAQPRRAASISHGLFGLLIYWFSGRQMNSLTRGRSGVSDGADKINKHSIPRLMDDICRMQSITRVARRFSSLTTITLSDPLSNILVIRPPTNTLTLAIQLSD